MVLWWYRALRASENPERQGGSGSIAGRRIRTRSFLAGPVGRPTSDSPPPLHGQTRGTRARRRPRGGRAQAGRTDAASPDGQAEPQPLATAEFCRRGEPVMLLERSTAAGSLNAGASMLTA